MQARRAQLTKRAAHLRRHLVLEGHGDDAGRVQQVNVAADAHPAQLHRAGPEHVH